MQTQVLSEVGVHRQCSEVICHLGENTSGEWQRREHASKDSGTPFSKEGLFTVFSHPFIFSFPKVLSMFSHKSPSSHENRPELQQPGKGPLGSDRMRHQRGPFSSAFLAFPAAVAGTVLHSEQRGFPPAWDSPTNSQVHSKSRSFPLPPPTRCRSTHPHAVLLLRRERWGLKRQSPACSERAGL